MWQCSEPNRVVAKLVDESVINDGDDLVTEGSVNGVELAPLQWIGFGGGALGATKGTLPALRAR